MTFKSTQVESAAGKLRVTGDLTIRGVTKEVVLDVEGPTPPVKIPREISAPPLRPRPRSIDRTSV
jgi:hypothetical protein